MLLKYLYALFYVMNDTTSSASNTAVVTNVNCFVAVVYVDV